MGKKVICTAMLAAAAFGADLPVTDVILYKNGIGYFVRSGEVAPGASSSLRFKAEEMNDVLKSLTLTGQDGAKISGVRYDSSQPLEQKLAEFPFQVGAGQPISALLDQLRGARLELKSGAETVAGVIVSAREIEGDDKHPRREEATLFTDSGDVRVIDLGGVSSIRFADAALQAQLKRYLSEVAAGRSKDKRSVYIEAADGRAHQLRATYVIPAPVWKSSYRLVFGEAAEPTLEGWAIVDNMTGEDWSKVRLALVSGRPVSFVSRLYEPHYVARQQADVLEETAEAPELHKGGVVGGVPGGVEGRAAGGMMAMKASPAPAPMLMAPKSIPRQVVEPAAESVELESSVAPEAEASERGELFEYRFGNPVTVRAGESAMLPFLQQKVTARKLLIYADHSAENPRNAAEITNSTGKTLDGGPITVFDSNAYAGEALVETVKAGDKRLISYAVDLGTRITTEIDSAAALVREIHLKRGILSLRSASVETTNYTIRNVDQKAKTLIIEHAIRPQFKLLKAKPAETTSNAYRFEVKLAAAATESLPVVEEHVFQQSIGIASMSPDLLVTYIENKTITDAGRKQLEHIASQQRAIAEQNGVNALLQEQINEIVRDQERLRQNIGSLNRVSGQQEQVQKYAAQLSDQEIKLAALRDQQSDLRKKKAALEAELKRLIDTAEF